MDIFDWWNGRRKRGTVCRSSLLAPPSPPLFLPFLLSLSSLLAPIHSSGHPSERPTLIHSLLFPFHPFRRFLPYPTSHFVSQLISSTLWAFSILFVMKFVVSFCIYNSNLLTFCGSFLANWKSDNKLKGFSRIPFNLQVLSEFPFQKILWNLNFY